MRPPRPQDPRRAAARAAAAAGAAGGAAGPSAPAAEAWKGYFDQLLFFHVPRGWPGAEDAPLPPVTTAEEEEAAGLAQGANGGENEGADAVDKFAVYTSGDPAHNILFCLHGCGHSAMSWALVTKLVKRSFFVVAFDCRGHGRSRCADEADLSAARLVRDGVALVRRAQLWVEAERARRAAGGAGVAPASPTTGLDALPVRLRILMASRLSSVPVVLMGHSMGGAIAIQLAAGGEIQNLQGLVVLDVIEELALEALPAMEKFVKLFPPRFADAREAVAWALQNKVLKNRASAELSIPSQLVAADDGSLRWRVPLAATAPFWEGWFRGISEQFVACRVGSGGKLLVLVGHDSLDKPLTIAHMQGKYQLQILPKSGHVIEEDQPDEVAAVLLSFARRFVLIPIDQLENGAGAGAGAKAGAGAAV